MRQTIPVTDLQRQRIITLHAELQVVQRRLDLFCDAILTGADIDTARVVDLTVEGLVVDLPETPVAVSEEPA